ncbi:copper resistance protein CopB [Lysobacter sp. Root916]|uniref:copper resistance protein B n=1 Tax=Lysobacter sp. Root916 TaxID=1736606 RepID=UPI00070B501B|nr:copper resistance protein B [Lysobacter sp. Root916]KRD39742.1 copper resistance protein CopB [Lysobacter sp. Root916]
MSALHSPRRAALAAALTLAFVGAAQAQHHAAQAAPTPPEPAPVATEPAVDHAAMGHAAPSKVNADHDSMDHSKMDHAAMGHAAPSKADADHGSMDHSKMDHAAMADTAPSAASQTPREPIPDVTDADRAAAFPRLRHHMQHAREFNSYVLFDRLEVGDTDHGRSEAWEATAWFGSDLNRVWLRSEGEREGGATAAADLEVLYGRSVTPWWDVVVGLKHDFKPGRSQDWLAVGVQGMSPYKFEVQATAYVGASGRVAANVEAEYDVLLTNRLILQPLVELDFNGSQDTRRGIGSGLSTLEAGLRLRYEFSRRFAPYVGVVHERSFGNTAELRRDEGEAREDTRVVAGVRIWF